MPNSQPVAYVVCLSSRPWALVTSWNFCTIGSFAHAGSLTSLTYWMRWTPAPGLPWSIRGGKNWLSDPQVDEMITIGFQSWIFSSSDMAWVQNVPDVSTSTTSALEADIVVNWLVRLAAVGSWNSWSMTFTSVPLMARSKPAT